MESWNLRAAIHQRIPSPMNTLYIPRASHEGIHSTWATRAQTSHVTNKRGQAVFVSGLWYTKRVDGFAFSYVEPWQRAQARIQVLLCGQTGHVAGVCPCASVTRRLGASGGTRAGTRSQTLDASTPRHLDAFVLRAARVSEAEESSCPLASVSPGPRRKNNVLTEDGTSGR